MFGNITATSAAQHQALDALIAEATAEGKTVDGLLVENPTPGHARFVLVLDDSPQTGSEYDRVFNFEGEEVTRGEGAIVFTVEHALGIDLSQPADLAA